MLGVILAAAMVAVSVFVGNMILDVAEYPKE